LLSGTTMQANHNQQEPES